MKRLMGTAFLVSALALGMIVSSAWSARAADQGTTTASTSTSTSKGKKHTKKHTSKKHSKGKSTGDSTSQN